MVVESCDGQPAYTEKSSNTSGQCSLTCMVIGSAKADRLSTSCGTFISSHESLLVFISRS